MPVDFPESESSTVAGVPTSAAYTFHSPTSAGHRKNPEGEDPRRIPPGLPGDATTYPYTAQRLPTSGSPGNLVRPLEGQGGPGFIPASSAPSQPVREDTWDPSAPSEGRFDFPEYLREYVHELRVSSMMPRDGGRTVADEPHKSPPELGVGQAGGGASSVQARGLDSAPLGPEAFGAPPQAGRGQPHGGHGLPNLGYQSGPPSGPHVPPQGGLYQLNQAYPSNPPSGSQALPQGG